MWGGLSFNITGEIPLQVKQKLLLRDGISKGSPAWARPSDISIKRSGVRYRKLERRERRASQSASWTAALEALCCDASSTCADCAAVFTAEKRFPRRPPGPLKRTVARASELPAADFHRWNFNEAFLGKMAEVSQGRVDRKRPLSRGRCGGVDDMRGFCEPRQCLR